MSLINKHKPDIIFLSETKTKSYNIKKHFKISKNYDHFFVEPNNKSGGLAMFWTHTLNLKILYSDNNMIHTGIYNSNNNLEYNITGFYGSPYHNNKLKPWKILNNLKTQDEIPRIVIGDLNVILDAQEKEGGKSISNSNTHKIQSYINKLNLTDMGFKGHPYTWNNRQFGENFIQERLDRALANLPWLQNFKLSCVTHLETVGSDHLPILLADTDFSGNKPKPFKFIRTWMSHPDCPKFIADKWTNHQTKNSVGI